MSVPDTFCFFVFFVGEDNGEPGCDGVPNSGQEWVRQRKLSATVISPPILGDALQLLSNAINAGSQPPERTLIAPISFPALKELQKVRTLAAQGH